MIYAIGAVSGLLLLLVYHLIQARVKVDRLQFDLSLAHKKLRGARTMYSNSIQTNQHLKAERDQLRAQLMAKLGASEN